MVSLSKGFHVYRSSLLQVLVIIMDPKVLMVTPISRQKRQQNVRYNAVKDDGAS